MVIFHFARYAPPPWTVSPPKGGPAAGARPPRPGGRRDPAVGHAGPQPGGVPREGWLWGGKPWKNPRKTMENPGENIVGMVESHLL